MKTNCAADGKFIMSKLSLEKFPENLPDILLLILITVATILVKTGVNVPGWQVQSRKVK